MKNKLLAALFGTVVGIIMALPLALIADNTNWSKPGTSDTYSAWPGYVKDLSRTAAMMDFTGDSSIPTNVIRYNRSTKQLEQYNGSTWDAQTITNIADGAVSSSAKMGTGVVTSTNILDATILTGDIAASTIVAGNIANSTITGAKIASATIAEGNLVSGTITGTAIATNTLISSKMSFNQGSSYTPTYTACNSMTGSGLTANGKYADFGSSVWFTMNATLTLGTTASKCMAFSLPTTSNESVVSSFACYCSMNSGTLRPCVGVINGAGASFFTVWSSDNANFTLASGNTIRCSGWYDK